MMCHQYVYAEAIPKECKPIIDSVKKPFKEFWKWPAIDHDKDDHDEDKNKGSTQHQRSTGNFEIPTIPVISLKVNS